MAEKKSFFRRVINQFSFQNILFFLRTIAIPISFLVVAINLTLQGIGITSTQTIGAWQLLNSRVPGNSGKKMALEFLHKTKNSLQHIDISCATMGQGWKEENGSCKRPVNLRDIDLSPSYFFSHGVNLSGANLSGVLFIQGNLSGANLQLAKLKGGFLQKVNFQKTNMRGADLSFSYAQGADFTDSILKNANFENSNLENAIFAFTQITGTSFRGANISGAHFCNFFVDIHVEGKDQSIPVVKLSDNGEVLQDTCNLNHADFDDAWAWADNLPNGFPKIIDQKIRKFRVCDIKLRPDYLNQNGYGLPSGC